MSPEAGLRVAVCEAPARLEAGGAEWETLGTAVRATRPDLLLLNEMPFGPWLAALRRPDEEAGRVSLRLHEAGLARLAELGAPAVLGTRPVRDGDTLRNEAFVWTEGTGVRGAGHTKQHFPEEEGYWEARWFEPGRERFGIARIETGAGELAIGFLICTDVWFNEHARGYGRRGVHLVTVPRATPPGSLDRWRTAVRMAALVSGCYAASSNRAGLDWQGQAFGGCGWIFSPEGDLLAETAGDAPVAVAELDLERVRRARTEYPRYVAEPVAAAPTSFELSAEVGKVPDPRCGSSGKVARMERKDAYRQKAEARIERLSAQLRELRARLREKAADARLDLAEQVEGLEKRRDEIRRRLDRIREAGEDVWEELRDEAEDALERLTAGVDALRSRLKREGEGRREEDD